MFLKGECVHCQLNVELAKSGHLETVAAATAVLTADVDSAAAADIAMEIVRQGEVKVGCLTSDIPSSISTILFHNHARHTLGVL